MLKITLTAVLLMASAIASAQTAEQQQLLVTYKVACASDAEVSVDQQLLAIVGDNQDAALARQDFQAFVASPKSVVESIVVPYNEMLKTIKDQLTTSAPEALQADAEKYAKENGVTVEEAKEALVAMKTEEFLAQQQIPPLDVLVYQTVASSCGLLTYIQPEITKTGCKTPVGEVADVTAAAQFCASIAPQLSQINEISGQMNAIQQQAQALIAAVTASIQKGAEAEMTPLAESLDVPFLAVVKAAMDLVAAPAPVLAPSLPAQDTTTTDEQAPTAPEAPAPGDDVPPPMQDQTTVPAQP